MSQSLARRQFLAAAASCALAGCGGASNRGSGQTLKVFNWSDYIAPELIPEFEERSGVRLVYDNFAGDAELEARLATGGDTYDVVFPSDRSLPVLLAKKLLQPIDRGQLQNFQHLDPKFLDAPFDPGNRFSVPYFWGTVAVGIRTDHVDPQQADGFGVLLDERYAGRITVLDDPEHVVGAMLLELGLPLNSVEPRDLARVQALLARQRPLLQAYTSDSYKERLISGQAWAAMGWSGDLKQAEDEAPQVRTIVPAGGTMLWLDSIAIPRGARQVALAHAFIDFLLEPSIAARNAEAVCFATPNRAALAALPADMRNDESIYLPESTLRRCAWLADRGEQITRIEAVWEAVRQ